MFYGQTVDVSCREIDVNIQAFRPELCSGQFATDLGFLSFTVKSREHPNKEIQHKSALVLLLWSFVS